MNKEMIISSGAHDTRDAILEDDQVVEIFIERENQRGVVGNIYKGRVSKVLPGMQSSFVDIGLERDAFFAAIAAPAYKDRIRANTDECAHRGGFGSPTIFLGDDMYFGNDRLVLLEAALQRDVLAGRERSS